MPPTRLSPQPLVDPTAQLTACRLGAYTEVGAGVRLLEVALGDYSYVIGGSEIAYATLGKFCSVAALTRIHPVNHPMERASQSHFTYRSAWYFDGAADDEALFARRRAQAVTVGHDVWVGHGAIILAGRSVGTGAVVAAGAVVTKDVAPYSIVAGNPARVVRQRFPDEIAGRLLALAWWDWSHDRLRAALADFRHLPVEAFLDTYEGALTPASSAAR